MTYHDINGITSAEYYDDGNIRQCKVDSYNEIYTKYGTFVPKYNRRDIRSKDVKSISFFENGSINSIYLENQTDIQTNKGVFPAEFISFYEDGAVDSIFPLNGQLGFGWSLADEAKLTRKLDFEFHFGNFCVKIIGIRFYQSGEIKSLILWPGETVDISTKYGVMKVRIGLRLYENGNIESIEPAVPISIATPIGKFIAFDTLALGADADFNSLRFNSDISINSFYTNCHIQAIQKSDGNCIEIYQKERINLTDDNMCKVPLKVLFYENSVKIDNSEKCFLFKINEFDFRISENNSNICLENNCDGCEMSCM